MGGRAQVGVGGGGDVGMWRSRFHLLEPATDVGLRRAVTLGLYVVLVGGVAASGGFLLGQALLLPEFGAAVLEPHLESIRRDIKELGLHSCLEIKVFINLWFY